MYCITEQQIAYILNDIRRNGVETEDLQLNLLDHICCIMEQELKETDDFEPFYQQTVKQFYKKELREIEEETINLLTFKNYYAMKKLMIISGALSVTAFLGGSVLKLLHWQGASAMFPLAILSFSLLFLPLLVILKIKEATDSRDKIITVLGSAVGILYSLATLFAIEHWEGRTMLWLATTGVSFLVFIPVYFFTGIRKPETKMNTIVTSILFTGITGLLFSMIAIRL